MWFLDKSSTFNWLNGRASELHKKLLKPLFITDRVFKDSKSEKSSGFRHLFLKVESSITNSVMNWKGLVPSLVMSFIDVEVWNTALEWSMFLQTNFVDDIQMHNCLRFFGNLSLWHPKFWPKMQQNRNINFHVFIVTFSWNIKGKLLKVCLLFQAKSLRWKVFRTENCIVHTIRLNNKHYLINQICTTKPTKVKSLKTLGFYYSNL